ncbi:MAG: hypothetical protein ACYSVY_12470 [Planctomycetota bacterium]
MPNLPMSDDTPKAIQSAVKRLTLPAGGRLQTRICQPCSACNEAPCLPDGLDCHDRPMNGPVMGMLANAARQIVEIEPNWHTSSA